MNDIRFGHALILQKYHVNCKPCQFQTSSAQANMRHTHIYATCPLKRMPPSELYFALHEVMF